MTQAKDIPTHEVLAMVRHLIAVRGSWATRWDVCQAFPDAPFKVVSAKLNLMARKGQLLSGCWRCHDCRGEFTMTPLGLLASYGAKMQ